MHEQLHGRVVVHTLNMYDIGWEKWEYTLKTNTQTYVCLVLLGPLLVLLWKIRQWRIRKNFFPLALWCGGEDPAVCVNTIISCLNMLESPAVQCTRVNIVKICPCLRQCIWGWKASNLCHERFQLLSAHVCWQVGCAGNWEPTLRW